MRCLVDRVVYVVPLPLLAEVKSRGLGDYVELELMSAFGRLLLFAVG